MFEQIGRAAEKVAAGVSRRDFLGRAGKGALALAGALGAFLALPGDVAAGNGCQPGTRMVRCPTGFKVCCPNGTKCRGCDAYNGCYCS